MRLEDLETLPGFEQLRWRTNVSTRQRPVETIGVVDHGDAATFVLAQQVVLSTGVSWPRDEDALATFLTALAARGIAALGLAVPRYFDRVPDATCRHAEALGLAVFEIPWDVPFSRLTASVHEALTDEKQRWAERSEEVHRVLTRAAVEDRDLGSLVRALAHSLARPTVVELAHGRIAVAYDPESERDDPEPYATAINRLVAAPETMQATGHGRAILLDDSLDPVEPGTDGNALALCAIRQRGAVWGRVWSFANGTPWERLDLRAMEHAALVVGLHLAHLQELEAMRAEVGASFVDVLLEGDPVMLASRDGMHRSASRLRESATSLGFDLAGRHALMAITFRATLPLADATLRRRDLLERNVRDLLRRASVTPFISRSANRILIVLPERLSPEALWTSLQVHALVGNDEVGAVCTRVATGIEELRALHQHAQPLLASPTWGTLTRYEALLVPLALRGDPHARRALIESTFGAVRPRPNLFDTLRAFARNDFRQSDTAKALGIHVNTLRYRIAQIERFTGLSFEDSETRFRVALTERLLDLGHEHPPPFS